MKWPTSSESAMFACGGFFATTVTMCVMGGHSFFTLLCFGALSFSVSFYRSVQ